MRNAFPTLADRLWPSHLSVRAARPAALAVAGTLALAISAKVQVPFYPVPLTLQTLTVLVLGAAFGTRLAAATVALYLLEGLLGLPVFAGAVAGPAYLAGPTGGFLAGFLLAAAFVGWCAERGYDRSPWTLLAVMAAGHALIFACGFGWLATLIGPERAWMGGVAPFALATLVKTMLAAALMPALWKLVGPARA